MEMNPVAQRIQAILDERGLKLKPVAEAAGVPYFSIYPWWQRPSSKPVYEKVALLAKQLEVPVKHLMYGDPLSLEEGRPPAEDLAARIQSLDEPERTEMESYLNFLESKKKGS